MELSGKSIIGSQWGSTKGKTFRGVNPSTGAPLEPQYYSAVGEEVNRAAQLAVGAFSAYSRTPGRARGQFLRGIAESIEELGGGLVERAVEETALPAGRIQGEIGRTCFQLRLFAQVVEEGSWTGARIDHGDPQRAPLPKPDVRSLWRPLGPVAVFCASNFPIAFSVAGGDTASALAAGNPVVVKAHAAHPGTAEMVGHAVRKAVARCGLPEGVFSLLFDAGIEVGLALVRHPAIRAVGFTGSRQGGKALMDAAAARPEPIPVYAEMSSVNPVFILPGAFEERGHDIAKGLHASVTLGAGQFCTKPGVVILPEEGRAGEFVAALGAQVNADAEYTLLTSRIRDSFAAGVKSRSTRHDVKPVAQHGAAAGAGGFRVGASLFRTDARTFLANGELQDEVFGPSALLVTATGREELLELARNLDGHLTATLHGTEEDLRNYADLVAILEGKVGRLIFNGYPTGVEVCHAMVHGGPYPATSDGRSTSVGTQAIYRFARLLCYQNFPDAALPDELKEGNPLALWRMVDGKITRGRFSDQPETA